MRIVFFGSSDFAVESLRKLIESKHEVLSVVTQPDRKKGRHLLLEMTSVKHTALKYKVQILQPEKINDSNFISSLKKLNVDIFVVVAYGAILPKKLLDIPELGSLNLHASLLPKYRGPSPIQSVILNGDEITGNTVMLLDEKMDHGPVLLQEKIDITSDETAQTLHDKLSLSGSKLLSNTCDKWIKRMIEPEVQPEDLATYCQLIAREDGKIDWQKPAEIIERQVRAYYPWPGTFTFLNKKRLKIISAKILNPGVPANKDEAGKTFITDSGELGLTCGQGTLIIKKLQLEGCEAMNSQNFILGHKEIINQKLGN